MPPLEPSSVATVGLTARAVWPRRLDATPAFWLCMFAASALGTNLGDFPVDVLGAERLVSFAYLLGASLAAICADRLLTGTEAGYWVAIVLLRSAATNVADGLTHDLRLGYVVPATALAVATLIAGGLTRADAPRNGVPRNGTPRNGVRGNSDSRTGSPVIDTRYWIAMGLGGIFGTVAGDLASHTVGLYIAAAGTFALLVAVLVVRRWIAPAAMLGYWVIVLAERCAGTPFGDMLASRRGLGLDPLGAMVVTAPVLAGALLLRWRLDRQG